jgi:predicted acylesterase/phospholipase RssA
MLNVWAGDGGGIFGIIPAEQNKNKDILGTFNAYGGTSISAAIAAYYATGKPPGMLPIVLNEAFSEIFSRPWYSWHHLPFGSKWPNDGLVAWLKREFPMNMGDLKVPFYAVSMDFANRRPKVFSSLGEDDKGIPVWYAVLSSVSAPTYFPPNGNYVDGGLFANTPSVVVAAELCRDLDLEIPDLRMFSQGTGDYRPIPYDMSHAYLWGLANWGARLFPVMFDGASEAGMEFIASQLYFDRYVRTNLVPLEENWDMDDISIIGAVVDRTMKYSTEFEKDYQSFIT